MQGRRRPARHASVRRVILAMAVMAAGVVWIPPAEAKTPSRSPERTLKCKNGKKAKFWWKGTKGIDDRGDNGVFAFWELTEFAVDNKCKDWLYITIETEPQSASDCCFHRQIAPGANFTKTGEAADRYGGFGTSPFRVSEQPKKCIDPEGEFEEISFDVSRDGKITGSEYCPRRYPESEQHRIFCPESWDPVRRHYTEQALATWKVDDKKILKLAVTSACKRQMIYRWETKDGERVALWIDDDQDFDLWKAELMPLPVKTKDGKVYFGAPPSPATASDLALYDENWRVLNGRPVLWKRTD